MHWIKVEPRYVQAQGPPLSTEVSFVRIDPGDCKLPQDNQSVSSSAFQSWPIKIVVGLRVPQDSYWLQMYGSYVYLIQDLRCEA